MQGRRIHPALLIVMLLVASPTVVAEAETEDLGNGFLNHGVATPVSNHRGIVATEDAEGRNVVLVWLFDHRGGYALLMIDAETGKSQQFPVPFPPGGDCPYASILSSNNKFYTHFNSHFVEFDPVRRAFTFHRATAPQMAMSMTEDDQGMIWSVTYPQSGVVSFNPATREFSDYGHVHHENWRQYPRSVAADDTGWIYFGIGSAASQIIALHRDAREATPVLSDHERAHGSGVVYPDANGKVYGHSGGQNATWYELYRGEATRLDAPPDIHGPRIIAGSQGLFHRTFPDGQRIRSCNLVHRTLEVEDPRTGEVRQRQFDYQSEGAHLMGLAVAPDGSLCGGTTFPMRFFRYDPEGDTWTNRPTRGQWNTVARQGDRFFVGGYGHGFLLEWDPARPWNATEKDNQQSNPRFITECHPAINRPHDLLAHSDGKTVILAGTPGYGLTGGGLLLYDRDTGQQTLLEHTDLLPNQATMSLVSVPGGKVLGGSTTSPGTGGEKKAREAELYLFDIDTQEIDWHEPVLTGVQTYVDTCPGSNGLVYGVADYHRFFVFDPEQRRVVAQQDTAAELGRTNSQQGPRVFVRDPRGTVYMLFRKGIARVDPETFQISLLARSPVPVGPGGDFLNGRIYFASQSHLYSYEVPADAGN